MEEEKKAVSERKKSCTNCGAELKYKPGTTEVTCEYCGHHETIIYDQNGFQELELKPYLEEMGSQSHSEEIMMLHCKNCGANNILKKTTNLCIACIAPCL